MPILFVPIRKVTAHEDGTCTVYSTAAVEEADKTREVFDYASGKPMVEKWRDEALARSQGKSMGNIRAMHGKSASGIATAINFIDVDKRIDAEILVIDPVDAKKCILGCYTGLSIGGDYVRKWPDPANPNLMRYTPSITEISLVDNPCQPSAVFQYVKLDGTEEMRKFAAVAPGIDTETGLVFEDHEGQGGKKKKLEKEPVAEKKYNPATPRDPKLRFGAHVDDNGKPHSGNILRGKALAVKAEGDEAGATSLRAEGSSHDAFAAETPESHDNAAKLHMEAATAHQDSNPVISLLHAARSAHHKNEAETLRANAKSETPVEGIKGKGGDPAETEKGMKDGELVKGGPGSGRHGQGQGGGIKGKAERASNWAGQSSASANRSDSKGDHEKAAADHKTAEGLHTEAAKSGSKSEKDFHTKQAEQHSQRAEQHMKSSTYTSDPNKAVKVGELKKNDDCNCDCPECQAGDCEDCSNDQCQDPNCEGSQMEEAAPVTLKKNDRCECECKACQNGECADCSNPDCKDPNCEGSKGEADKIAPLDELKKLSGEPAQQFAEEYITKNYSRAIDQRKSVSIDDRLERALWDVPLLAHSLVSQEGPAQKVFSDLAAEESAIIEKEAQVEKAFQDTPLSKVLRDAENEVAKGGPGSGPHAGGGGGKSEADKLSDKAAVATDKAKEKDKASEAGAISVRGQSFKNVADSRVARDAHNRAANTHEKAATAHSTVGNKDKADFHTKAATGHRNEADSYDEHWQSR